jgi:hypothetical protein
MYTIHKSLRISVSASTIRRITATRTANTSNFFPLLPTSNRLFSTTSTKFSGPSLNQNLKELWGITSSTSGKMSTQQVPNEGIPKHEMVYLKGLASSARGFGEFRRVLFTGLYSQVAVMEIPVGGEIGDEVSTHLCLNQCNANVLTGPYC